MPCVSPALPNVFCSNEVNVNCKFSSVSFTFPRNTLEVDLKIERDWRSGLQEELARVNENLSQMEERARELEDLQQVESGCAMFYTILC